MIVDLGLGARRPDERLQSEGVVPALVATGYVPACLSASRLFQQRNNLSLHKDGILHKMNQEGSGLLHSQVRGKLGEPPQFVSVQRHTSRPECVHEDPFSTPLAA